MTSPTLSAAQARGDWFPLQAAYASIVTPTMPTAKKAAGKKAVKKVASAAKARKGTGAAQTKTVATRSRPQAAPVALTSAKAQASARALAQSNCVGSFCHPR